MRGRNRTQATTSGMANMGFAGSWRTVSVEPTGLAGGLLGDPKSPAPPALRVARHIELMHERDIWVRPGKDDVS